MLQSHRTTHNCNVDTEGDPEPLSIGKGVWSLPKSDGRCHVGDKIEGIKER